MTRTTFADLDAAVARATSNYLAVSRQAHLYAPEAYERGEAAAWERLREAVLARDAAGADEEEALCTASR